ncbi:MAG: site-specific integrase [Clostridiales bacterium]|jgi:integrase|nr:site-specific integrase [Clostridiales bacterium]
MVQSNEPNLITLRKELAEMATYTVRGANSHSIVYWYEAPTGEKRQHWETYQTELEAVQRKAQIDYLQKKKFRDELYKAAMEYKEKREKERVLTEIGGLCLNDGTIPQPAVEDNSNKTYREFVEKWLPFHARKNRFSPNSYDSYKGNLDNHILPYFGDRTMNTITSEDIDNFMDYLSKKPCRGSKSFRKNPKEIPSLSSSSVKKCYTVLTAGFSTAKKWRYITEIPNTTAPLEKTVKRKAWESKQISEALQNMKDDKLLHLIVHLAFVCSLRAGETTGINIKTIDFHDRSLWITQEVQRVSDQALAVLPKNEILRVFPKDVPTAKTSLILKTPKTEGSIRKQYLTSPLLQEIKARLADINANKDFFGGEYKDYDLLICKPDGRPIDSKNLDKWFKDWQTSKGISDQIEFQGLRKSGQMHKVRLTKNNYQLVAESGGQSPEVLMSNYNEALDSEKRTLSLLVETSFYPRDPSHDLTAENKLDIESTFRAIQGDPDLARQILQLLLSNAANGTQ